MIQGLISSASSVGASTFAVFTLLQGSNEVVRALYRKEMSARVRPHQVTATPIKLQWPLEVRLANMGDKMAELDSIGARSVIDEDAPLVVARWYWMIFLCDL